MDPVTFAAAVLGLVDWKSLFKKFAEDSISSGLKSGRDGLLRRLKPTERERVAREAVGIFTREFLQELDDKNPFSAALEGYEEGLKRLIEAAALDIAAWLQPEIKAVDLGPVERMWSGLGLHPLPAAFNWALVAENYARALRQYVRRDPALRAELEVALQQDSHDFEKRFSPGFDLAAYRDFLRKKCATLQLSPLHTSAYDRRVGLWSVFVPQSARESAPVRDLPRELLRRLRIEGHVLQERDEQDLERLGEAYASAAPGPVFEIFDRQRLLVLLGDPGSGKTSLLKYTVLRWVNEDQGPVPLWIDLREYARRPDGIVRYLESEQTFGLEAGRVSEHLSGGKAALYLDGLDEIFAPQIRAAVIEQIAAFSARYPQARCVVTSRIIGYEPERLRDASFAHATLEEFDDPQIALFLEKWHIISEEDPKERTRLSARLRRAIQESRAIRELAGNPLLLTMMAILNRNQELPRDRVELYREASRVLLHEWDASRSLPVDVFGRQEKEALLRELAGAMQQGEGGLAGNLIEHDSLLAIIRRYLKSIGIEAPYEKAHKLVQQLTERNFILCCAGANRFSFVHRTFLEYFCAAWFVHQFQDHTLSPEQLKTEVYGRHWEDETWHEVLRLIAGMIGEKQAEQLILFLMEQDGRWNKLANVMLAAGCLSEVRNRRPIAQTDRTLSELMLQRAIRYDPPYLYENYQVYDEVGPTRSKAVGLIASVWSGSHSWLRSAATQDADWIVRRAAIQELARGWKNDPDTLPILKDRARFDENSNVRYQAVEGLAREWKDDPDTLPILKDRACSDDDPNMRSGVIQDLARGWKDDPDTLPILKDRACSDEYPGVRLTAVRELARGWKDDPDTLPIVKDRARSDEHEVVRLVAVQELVRAWKYDPDTLPILKDSTSSDEALSVRSAALQELARGWKDDPDTLSILKNRACYDHEPYVRSTAVEELARGWKNDPDTLPIVKHRARSDDHPNVRSGAVEEVARGWKDDPETLSILKDRVRFDEHPYVRRAAVQQLARWWKEDPYTLPILKDRAHSDEDWTVRFAAAQELARGWRDEPDTLPLLKDRARSDENWSVRIAAVQELARGWKEDPDTLPILKDLARSHEDPDARHTAVRELARGWKDDPEVKALLQDLETEAN
ncbi:MAG: HEAT repeat domain-containing protein [Acidobacteriia bacterium]|nr:HEAT repeat domain-containing protein [Terriglobia bacterium]